MTIPVFVISLPEAKDRQQRVAARLGDLSIAFTFFDAVDGREFNMETHPAYNGSKRRRYFGKDLTGGEMGCLLSHRSIYEKMIEEGLETVLVFEDDVIIHDDFPVVLEALLSSSIDYDLVRFLGSPKVATLTQRPVAQLCGEYTLNRLCTTPGGAHAYLINQNGARKLLKHTEYNWLPIDTLMGYCWLTGLNAFIVQPGIAVHNLELESFIGEARFDKSMKPSVIDRALFKVSEGLMKRLTYWALWPWDLTRKQA